MFFLSKPSEAARAASYTVCEPGPPTCDYDSIQSAVDAAGDGDEIKVAEGTYTGINNQGGHAQVVYLDKSLTIRGGYTTTNWTTSDPVANPTTLDAERGGRVLYITGHISPTIEGLRITGGDATVLGNDEDGGGVFIQFATPTFIDNQVFRNTADNGGGFNLDNSAATLNHNTIISNSANGGGGLWMWQCDNATLNQNTISFNTAYTQTGGLWSGGASDNIIFNGNTFSNNTSGGFAGGLELQGEGYTLIENTIISNTAIHGAGGLFLLGGDFTLTGNTISYNNSEHSTGIFLWYSSARLIGNDISGNSAADHAGGIAIGNSNALLSGNIISANSADYYGGLSIGNSIAMISYNTIISNTANNQGGGVNMDGDVEFIGNTVISNTAGESGGGLSILDVSGLQTIDGNIFSGNSAGLEGGGLMLGGGKPILTNNLIFDNHADGYGSAITISSGSPHLIHNTIARNRGGDGSGLWIGGSTVTVTNTIIVSHTVGIYVETSGTATIEATLWGNEEWANDTDWVSDGTINITADLWGDPDFVDPDAGDYHISPVSDAIDAGIDAGVMRDIDNQPRPYQVPDIGADEYWPPGVLKYIYLPLVMK